MVGVSVVVAAAHGLGSPFRGEAPPRPRSARGAGRPFPPSSQTGGHRPPFFSPSPDENAAANPPPPDKAAAALDHARTRPAAASLSLRQDPPSSLRTRPWPPSSPLPKRRRNSHAPATCPGETAFTDLVPRRARPPPPAPSRRRPRFPPPQTRQQSQPTPFFGRDSSRKRAQPELPSSIAHATSSPWTQWFAERHSSGRVLRSPGRPPAATPAPVLWRAAAARRPPPTASDFRSRTLAAWLSK